MPLGTAPGGAAIPAGIIVMWAGTLATIPAGWALCDGGDSRPDLRDKFIYGWSDGVDPGGEGGATTHTHTYSDLPQHDHGVGTLATNGKGAHVHRIRNAAGVLQPVGGGAEVWSDKAYMAGLVESSGNHTHTISGSVASQGVANPETDAGSTLPPYYKLAFIIKT